LSSSSFPLTLLSKIGWAEPDINESILAQQTQFKNINKANISVSTSIESKEYSLIALFSILGASFLLSSGDLLSMYLSIELQSFGLYY